MNPARFRWGILIIMIGGLMLMTNIGAIDEWGWYDILALWPLLLIAIGLEKIFTHIKKLRFLAYAAPLALAAVIFYVAVNASDFGSDLDRDDGYMRYQVEMEEGLQAIDASFDMNDVDVMIRPTTAHLFSGTFRSRRTKPDIDFSKDNGIANFRIDEAKHIGFSVSLPGFRGPDRWTARFTDELPLNLKINGDEADFNLELQRLNLQELEVNSESGDVDIELGKLSDNVKVSLTGEEATFNIYVPRGCGLKIAGLPDVSQFWEKELGLEKMASVLQSTGYDTLNPKIEVTLNQPITSIGINYR